MLTGRELTQQQSRVQDQMAGMPIGMAQIAVRVLRTAISLGNARPLTVRSQVTGVSPTLLPYSLR